MNSIHIFYTEAAIDDLDLIFDYISTENYVAAHSLLDKLESGINKLKEFPKLGAVLPANELSYIENGYRFLTINSYMIFYRIEEEKVIIARILDSRRDWLFLLFEGK